MTDNNPTPEQQRPPSLSEHEVLGRNAQFNRVQLHRAIVDELNSQGVVSVLPVVGEDATPLQQELHNRLHTLPEEPSLAVENVRSKMVDGYISSTTTDRTFASIDGVISGNGPQTINLDNLNKYGLNKLEQLLICRGALIAAGSRIIANNKYSPATQKKLYKKAYANINHFANTPLDVPGPESEDAAIEEFGAKYALAYMARAIQEEAAERGVEMSETSIEDVMRTKIPFALLASGDADEILSIFNHGESRTKPSSDEEGGFREISVSELDNERIENLRSLAETFGRQNRTYRVYESYRPFVSQANVGVETEQPPREESDAELQASVAEQAEYVVVVMKHVGPDGRIMVDVVADNPAYANACYVLRQEVLDFWKEIAGVNLSWQDVFSYKKAVTRQMGARAFRHTSGTDVSKRVMNYLKEDPKTAVYDAFALIFDKDRGFFGPQGSPTRKNRMPKYLKRAIKSSEKISAMWPLIQDMGFVDAMKMIEDQENASDVVAERKPAFDARSYAFGLLEQIISLKD